MQKEYTLAEGDVSKLTAKCPCCGATPEIYEVRTEPAQNVLKLVVCSTNSLALFGTSSSDSDLSCPLFSQSDEIEHELAGATYREAVQNWNKFCSLLEQAKLKNTTSQPTL